MGLRFPGPPTSTLLERVDLSEFLNPNLEEILKPPSRPKNTLPTERDLAEISGDLLKKKFLLLMEEIPKYITKGIEEIIKREKRDISGKFETLIYKSGIKILEDVRNYLKKSIEYFESLEHFNLPKLSQIEKEDLYHLMPTFRDLGEVLYNIFENLRNAAEILGLLRDGYYIFSYIGVKIKEKYNNIEEIEDLRKKIFDEYARRLVKNYFRVLESGDIKGVLEVLSKFERGERVYSREIKDRKIKEILYLMKKLGIIKMKRDKEKKIYYKIIDKEWRKSSSNLINNVFGDTFYDIITRFEQEKTRIFENEIGKILGAIKSYADAILGKDHELFYNLIRKYEELMKSI